MGFSKEVIDTLTEPLEVFSRQGPSGIAYKYHKGEDVQRRLNKAFGHEWSSRVVSREEIYGQVLIMVELSVPLSTGLVIHQGFGSAPVAKKKNTDEVIDIGNTYKSAFTKALRKAAEQFGIGLGGADEEDDNSVSEKPATPAAPAKAWQPKFTPRTNNNPSPAPQQKTEPPKYVKKDLPGVVADGPITDFQLDALKRLCTAKRRDHKEVLEKIPELKNSGKDSFSQLTKMEASRAIQYLNNPSSAATE